MASLLRRRPIASLCSIFCRQQHRRCTFRCLCCGPHPKVTNVTFDVCGQTTSIEACEHAWLANLSAVINTGDTQVLSAVVSYAIDHPLGFRPLYVYYQDKDTPYMRSEEVQKECGHLIDRSIRPLFPAGFFGGIEVWVNVLSFNSMYDRDVMAANATSAALMLSDIPWNGPIGVIRVGRIDGKFIFNPTMDELRYSDLNLVYACTKDKTVMIDGHGWEITEKDLQTGLKLAHSEAVKYIDPQIRLAEKAGQKKREYKLSMVSDRKLEKIRSIAEAPIKAVFTDSTCGKFQCEALHNITRTVKAKLAEECDEKSLKVLPKAIDMVRNEIIRRRIIDQGLRIDGRQLDEVRPLVCEFGIYGMLPGSSPFYGRNTRVLCIVTREAPGDARGLHWIVEPPSKRFKIDFTPISIIDFGMCGGLNIWEVERGTLAEKALLAVLPPHDDFPYHVFVNYRVFVSDGSISKATVCGASMALMQAGFPIREHVAGVSVGLVSDVDPSGRITGYRILTDLSDFEDQLGDVDFRIAGTRKGITAIQLDIKPAGLPLDIICECLEPARKGRNQILDHMEEEIDAPCAMLDPYGTIALCKHVQGLTNDIERSNEMVCALQEKLEAKDHELRKWKELFSQKEENEQRND